MLFSDRSVITMVHGIAVSGGALAGLTAALFGLLLLRVRRGDGAPTIRQSRALALVLAGSAVLLWLAILSGTYVVFPLYRVTPPAGLNDLAQYPRAQLLADPNTAWLHAFAMEIKEHVPWIAAMLATAAAFVVGRYPVRLFRDALLSRAVVLVVTLALVLGAWVGILGTFVNKVAPLE
jgi:hypothetical protein